MASASSSFKAQHAMDLLSSLNNMRNEERICDFSIKVGPRLFAVHRAVVAASSEYFKAMLSHNMKEEREGVVDIRDITDLAMEKCIEFMYSGEIQLQLGYVGDILHAATFLRLDLLVVVCFDYLKRSLCVETALIVKEVGLLHFNEEFCEHCEDYIVANFAEISKTEAFLSLSQKEIKKYVENRDIDVRDTWHALMAWTKHHESNRKSNFVAFFKSLCERNPSVRICALLFWKEPDVKNSPNCREVVCDCVLSDLQQAKENIDVETCFSLKEIAQNMTHSSCSLLDDEVTCYMVDHFEKVSVTEGWKSLSKEDVCKIMRTKDIVCSSEKIKWNAALAWAKHAKRRKRQFHDLLALLDFSLLSDQFINETIGNEQLIRESTACMALVMDALADRARELRIQEASESRDVDNSNQSEELENLVLHDTRNIRQLLQNQNLQGDPLEDTRENGEDQQPDVPRTIGSSEGNSIAQRSRWAQPSGHHRWRHDRGYPPHHFHPSRLPLHPPPHQHPPPHRHDSRFHHPPRHHHPPHPHRRGRGRGWRQHHHHWHEIMHRIARHHDSENEHDFY